MRHPHRLLVALSTLVLVPLLPPQTPTHLRLAGRLHITRDYVRVSDVALADVDGDRDLDLVAGGSGDARIFLGNGLGRFFLNTSSTSGVSIGLPRLGDVDSDGDLDIVAKGPRLFVNDGAGRFSQAAQAIPSVGMIHEDSALGDLDGDHDLDIAFVGAYGGLWIADNDGTGTFTVARVDAQSFWHVEVGDAEADGDLDVFAFGNGAALFVNQGGGNLLRGPAIPFPTSTIFVARVADLDGDQDLDVVGGQGLVVLRNDGASFTDVSAAVLPAAILGVRDLALVDADGDRAPDLWVAASGQNRLLLNRGGTFVFAPLPDDRDQESTIATGDVDGDGDLDLVAAHSSSLLHLYLADGVGSYARVTAVPLDPLPIPSPAGSATADLDGDGVRDFVFANGCSSCAPPGAPGRSALLLGDGRGNFTDVSSLAWPTLSSNAVDVAVGDVDNDGDVDVLFGNQGGRDAWFEHPAPNALYLNDGTARFALAPSAFGSIQHATVRVELADLDGDGDLDLFELSDQPRITWNDGTGRFVNETVAPGLGGTIIDIDRDSDLDFVNGASLSVQLNDGSGRFQPGFTSTISLNSIDFADFDGDQDIDIVGAGTTTRARLYLQDGAGNFVPAAAEFGSATSSRIVAIDLDRDDDADVLDSLGYAYLNDGSGTLNPQSDAIEGWRPVLSSDRVVHDFDDDGDLDIYDGLTLLVGTLRQVSVLRIPSLGGSLALDYHESTMPNATRTAQPVLAAFPARIALPPLGILGIDPAASIALPAVTIGAGSLHTPAFVGIPSQPSLLGARVFVQALFVTGTNPATWRLSNVIEEVITAY